MARVKVVTAYVDLGLAKRTSKDFHVLGTHLIGACKGLASVHNFTGYLFGHCWAVEMFGSHSPPANKRAEDRFMNQDEHLRSNLIQHSPLQWLTLAAEADPEPDVFVWMGYSILKQGAFTGKPVTKEAIQGFLKKLKSRDWDHIPIPAIRPDDPISPHGDNWQFVGSTVIAPRQFLPEMARHYKLQLREFVRCYNAIPLDLAIWPAVVRNSGLPFRPYPAEYDATQLTGLP